MASGGWYVPVTSEQVAIGQPRPNWTFPIPGEIEGGVLEVEDQEVFELLHARRYRPCVWFYKRKGGDVVGPLDGEALWWRWVDEDLTASSLVVVTSSPAVLVYPQLFKKLYKLVGMRRNMHLMEPVTEEEALQGSRNRVWGELLEEEEEEEEEEEKRVEGVVDDQPGPFHWQADVAPGPGCLLQPAGKVEEANGIYLNGCKAPKGVQGKAKKTLWWRDWWKRSLVHDLRSRPAVWPPSSSPSEDDEPPGLGALMPPNSIKHQKHVEEEEGQEERQRKKEEEDDEEPPGLTGQRPPWPCNDESPAPSAGSHPHLATINGNSPVSHLAALESPSALGRRPLAHICTCEEVQHPPGGHPKQEEPRPGSWGCGQSSSPIVLAARVGHRSLGVLQKQTA